MTAAVIIIVVVGLIVWGVIASKRTSEHKKAAIAELKVQKEQIEPFDIHSLVTAEINDLGLRDIDGAAGIPASVLLKTWKEHADIVDGCPSRDLLSFVVTPGLDPSEALDSDVTLVCDADAIPSDEAPMGEEPDLELPDPELADDSDAE